MKRSVTVTIAGQRFALRSDLDDRAVRVLAEFVDGKVREAQKATRTPDTQSAAVLAALQIAEELFALRRSDAELRKRIKDRGRAILDFIERQARI